MLNDDDYVVKKKKFCCFNNEKKISKLTYNSEQKALLEKTDKQRKIEEANKANKSLSSRMSSEYF